MKDRIQKYMDEKNINAGELATMLEVQRSNISHILNGRNKPSAAFIEKMLVVFPDLNARWLLTGEGAMLEIINGQKDIDSGRQVASPVSSLHPERVEATKHVEQSTPPVRSSDSIETKLPDLTDDDIEKIIVLYRSGTFSSFKRK